ncbi:hypothetical protein HK096_001933, partial [Nowakowskiella sp. JEL0078]
SREDIGADDFDEELFENEVESHFEENEEIENAHLREHEYEGWVLSTGRYFYNGKQLEELENHQFKKPRSQAQKRSKEYWMVRKRVIGLKCGYQDQRDSMWKSDLHCWWSKLNEMVKDFVKSCDECQRATKKKLSEYGWRNLRQALIKWCNANGKLWH